MAKQHGRAGRGARRGTSLIEILVVMVVFLVGILAIVQIFPGGFKLLAMSRNKSTATSLTRSEIERYKNRTEQLAEMVVPVRYAWNAGGWWDLVPNADNSPNQFDLPGDQIRQDGVVLAGAQAIDHWGYVSGANIWRRVVGEGAAIPAPRDVGGGQVGGLLILQNGPLLGQSAVMGGAAFRPALLVYGDDLVRIGGAPTPDTTVREYEYYVDRADQPSGEIFLPRGELHSHGYRFSASAWIQSGGTVRRKDVLGVVVPVGFTSPPSFERVALNTLVGLQAGESLVGVELDSIRVARIFEEVPDAGSFDQDEAHQYAVLDRTLGILLFNPDAHGYTEQRASGRIPLRARIDYDVLDWRILKEDFRVDESNPTQLRTAVPGWKVIDAQGPDNRNLAGLPVALPNGSGGTERRSFALVDTETGGIYLERSTTRTEPGGQPRRLQRVNGTIGVLTLVDADGDPANGLTGELVLPGQSGPTDVNMTGRNVRLMYEGLNEWAIHPLRAAPSYAIAYGFPGLAECYVGGSSQHFFGAPLSPLEIPTRIYFPRMDEGRPVHIDEVWYSDANGAVRSIQAEEFVITPPRAGELPLPYVDISSKVDPAAVLPVQINFQSYGYGARGVKGSSLALRAMFNPNRFNLGGDFAANVAEFERWSQGWRRVVTETFLTPGGAQ